MTHHHVNIERQRARSELLTRVTWVLVVLAVIATAIIQSVVLITLNRQVNTAVAQAEANGETSDRVIELVKQVQTIADQIAAQTRKNRNCSTVGHACYERQQASVTDLVENINKITLLTAVCSDNLPGKASALEVRACVVNYLAHHPKGTP